jgi:hypothetical protein
VGLQEKNSRGKATIRRERILIGGRVNVSFAWTAKLRFYSKKRGDIFQSQERIFMQLCAWKIRIAECFQKIR